MIGVALSTLRQSGTEARRIVNAVVPMIRKIRELIRDLEAAGFFDRGGKGDHRNFVHPKVTKPVTISGKPGDDAKHYQEKAVMAAIEESKRWEKAPGMSRLSSGLKRISAVWGAVQDCSMVAATGTMKKPCSQSYARL